MGGPERGGTESLPFPLTPLVTGIIAGHVKTLQIHVSWFYQRTAIHEF
jgi:hypothetical protein